MRERHGHLLLNNVIAPGSEDARSDGLMAQALELSRHRRNLTDGTDRTGAWRPCPDRSVKRRLANQLTFAEKAPI